MRKWIRINSEEKRRVKEFE